MEKPRPTHRRHTPRHDYRGRCIYHVTLVCSDRQPVLGRIVGDSPEEARCELTPLGVEVSRCIAAIPLHASQRGRDVRVLAKVVMPEHVHFVVYVARPMDCTLGELVHGMKVACNAALRRLIERQAAVWARGTSPLTNGEQAPEENRIMPVMGWQGSSAAAANDGRGNAARRCAHQTADARIVSPRMLSRHALFEPDFDETILRSRGQLRAMIDYVHHNPSHRWLRQHKPGWLLPIRGIEINGESYDALGNVNLLGLQQCQVLVHHYWYDTTRRNYMNGCMLQARRGAALVSPFISEAEQTVRNVALREGHSIIQLTDNGFGDYAQCPGNLYDYCVRGQVLLLVPSSWPRIDKKGRISRAECMRLNAIAQELASADKSCG